MSFTDDMNYFYYRSSISELRAMHAGDYSPGLSYHSMLYLSIIAGTPSCTVSKLAEILQITRSAVTIKVKELVRRGFVEKQQSD
jgi:DNA-binding MarR family transcriptional regulator